MPNDPWDVEQIEAKAPDEKSVKEARKVLTKGGFGRVEPRADGQGWYVVCRGLTGTYEVTVKLGPRGGLESRCTCPSPKKPCKHAIALLLYLAEHPQARPEAEVPAPRSSGDFESLLRAAFAAPTDDTTRLVLADYLEENDQPDRAALIRVQCEIARLSAKDPGLSSLLAEEKKLMATVKRRIGSFPAHYTGRFARGFLSLSCGSVGADAIPARFARVFRDGWVETIRSGRVLKGLIPLFRLAGTVDLSRTYITTEEMERLVEGLQFGHPETRARIVRVPPEHEQLYRSLTAQFNQPS